MIFRFRQKSYSDTQIVSAYQVTDRKAQQFWYEKCRDQFGKGTSKYRGIADTERKDLFQNSFILLWGKMESKQIYVSGNNVHVTTKEGDNIIPDLLGYFMKIVRNKYLELLRSGKGFIAVNDAVLSSNEDLIDNLYWDEDPEVEKDRIVVQCLQSLPKSCLEILTMFYYEKKSLAQILEERAENTSYDGLKSRKSKCMANLKNKITKSFAKAGLR